jgi:hypothetical protein
MESLSKELGREREGANILEHFCYQCIVQWRENEGAVEAFGEFFGEAGTSCIQPCLRVNDIPPQSPKANEPRLQKQGVFILTHS